MVSTYNSIHFHKIFPRRNHARLNLALIYQNHGRMMEQERKKRGPEIQKKQKSDVEKKRNPKTLAKVNRKFFFNFFSNKYI